MRHRRHEARIFRYAFDLLELEGEDRRRGPLHRRKLDLTRVLASSGPGVRLNEWIEDRAIDGATTSEHARKLGLEGIVSKRKDSRYRAGRRDVWLKSRNSDSAAVKREAEEEWNGRRQAVIRSSSNRTTLARLDSRI